MATYRDAIFSAVNKIKLLVMEAKKLMKNGGSSRKDMSVESFGTHNPVFGYQHFHI